MCELCVGSAATERWAEWKINWLRQSFNFLLNFVRISSTPWSGSGWRRTGGQSAPGPAASTCSSYSGDRPTWQTGEKTLNGFPPKSIKKILIGMRKWENCWLLWCDSQLIWLWRMRRGPARCQLQQWSWSCTQSNIEYFPISPPSVRLLYKTDWSTRIAPLCHKEKDTAQGTQSLYHNYNRSFS